MNNLKHNINNIQRRKKSKKGLSGAILFSIFVVINLQAQDNFYLSGGINQSNFIDQTSDFLTGFSFGFGKEYKINRENWYGGFELRYSRRNGKIRNIVIQPVYLGTPVDVYEYNINIKLDYAEIFILLKKSFHNDKYHVGFGPSLAIPIFENSKIDNENFQYVYDPWEDSTQKDLQFKYKYLEEGGHPNILVNVNADFGFQILNNIVLSLAYSLAIKPIGIIDPQSSIRISNHFQTLNFNLLWSL